MVIYGLYDKLRQQHHVLIAQYSTDNALYTSGFTLSVDWLSPFVINEILNAP